MKSAYENMENNRTKNPEKSISVALTTASSLGSFSNLDESQKSLGPMNYSVAASSLMTGVVKLKEQFEEKLAKIQNYLDSFESQFFAKNNEFFMQLVVNEVSLTKNVEYDMNNLIKVW